MNPAGKSAAVEKLSQNMACISGQDLIEKIGKFGSFPIDFDAAGAVQFCFCREICGGPDTAGCTDADEQITISDRRKSPVYNFQIKAVAKPDDIRAQRSATLTEIAQIGVFMIVCADSVVITAHPPEAAV